MILISHAGFQTSVSDNVMWAGGLSSMLMNRGSWIPPLPVTVTQIVWHFRSILVLMTTRSVYPTGHCCKPPLLSVGYMSSSHAVARFFFLHLHLTRTTNMDRPQHQFQKESLHLSYRVHVSVIDKMMIQVRVDDQWVTNHKETNCWRVCDVH